MKVCSKYHITGFFNLPLSCLMSHTICERIESFHAYFNNNGSHKDHISGYSYIIKYYLKLLVTFCHALLHYEPVIACK